jgi:phosphatidate cytidylyltransferase
LLPAIFSDLAPDDLGFFSCLVLGGLIGALAIFSDLLGSALKRNASVKDSGSGIPGIGGGLDLVDSLLLTAPFACAAFVLLL